MSVFTGPVHLLTRFFREALLRLNPWITPAQMDEAQRTLEHRLSTSSLLQINEEKYFLIRDGIPVTVKKPGGKTETKHAAVIDFKDPSNNHFLAIKELKIHGDLYRRRTDIVGFVNGIPLLFIELKKNTVDVQDAYTNNYTDYQDTIPHLFYFNAFLITYNTYPGPWSEPYASYEEVEPAASAEPAVEGAKDVVAMFSNIEVTGDFYNGTTGAATVQNLQLLLDNATVNGVISATFAQHEKADLYPEDWQCIGVVENTVCPAVNNGVILILQNGAVWNVTGESYLTKLVVEEGCTVNGVVTELPGGGILVTPAETASASGDVAVSVNTKG